MNYLEISKEEYAKFWEFFNSQGADLHMGPHEGSSLQMGEMYLCHSDGIYWLAKEED